MMDQQTISDKLFYLTTKIITFDEENFRRNILSEISAIFGFEVCTYLNVIDYEKVFLTEFKSKIPEIVEEDFLIFSFPQFLLQIMILLPSQSLQLKNHLRIWLHR